MPAAIVGRTAMLDALATILASGTYSVHLFVNLFTPTMDSTLGSFAEPVYDTYPVGGIVPPLPTFGNLGPQCAMSQVSVVFPAPLTGPPIAVWGFFVVFRPHTLPLVPAMLLAGRFGPAPRILSVGGPTLPLLIDFADFQP